MRTPLLILALLFIQNVFGVSDHFFSDVDAFLKKYVQEGKVKYSSINKAEIKVLTEAIANTNLKGCSDDEIFAFYINSYNILVIKSVLDNNIPKSPLDVSGFFDAKKHNVAGSLLTLNDIENNVIRKKWKEPRIHFVLVCAAIGCPKIENFAYQPKLLYDQLLTQTKKAVNDNSFIKVSNGKVDVSQIFEWYIVDFGNTKKGILDFINKYRTNKIPSTSNVGYYEYNWQLNKL